MPDNVQKIGLTNSSIYKAMSVSTSRTAVDGTTQPVRISAAIQILGFALFAFWLVRFAPSADREAMQNAREMSKAVIATASMPSDVIAPTDPYDTPGLEQSRQIDILPSGQFTQTIHISNTGQSTIYATDAQWRVTSGGNATNMSGIMSNGMPANQGNSYCYLSGPWWTCFQYDLPPGGVFQLFGTGQATGSSVSHEIIFNVNNGSGPQPWTSIAPTDQVPEEPSNDLFLGSATITSTTSVPAPVIPLLPTAPPTDRGLIQSIPIQNAGSENQEFSYSGQFTNTGTPSAGFGFALDGDPNRCSGSTNGQSTSFSCSGMVPGNSTVNVQVDIPPFGGGTLNWAGEVQSTGNDPESSNNSASGSWTYQRYTDLKVEISSPSQSVDEQSTPQFQIDVTNLGPSTSRDVFISIELPAEFPFGQVTSPASPSVTLTGNTLNWGMDPMTQTETSSLIFSTTVNPPETLPTSRTITATMTSLSGTDFDTNNDQAQVEIQLVALQLTGSGSVFIDTNADGTQGPGETSGLGEVKITIDVDLDGMAEENEPSTTSSSDGSFELGGLTQGSNKLLIAPPDPYLPVFQSLTVDIPSPSEVPTIYVPIYAPGSIFGSKFRDDDGDGIWDSPGEPGLQNWTITCQGPSCPAGTTTTTDANGAYSFTGLQPGTYTIGEVAQSGWVQSAPSGAGTHTVLVQSGSLADGNDFGNIPPPTGQIHGQKFLDLDGDGEKDENEPGLNGVTIRLETSQGSLIKAQETHAMDLNEDGFEDPLTEWGLFWFEDLEPGSVIVNEAAVPGMTATAPASGQFDLTLSHAQIVQGLKFGNKPNGAMDWGDLPDPRLDLANPCPSGAAWNECYSTLNANRGPSHVIIPQPFVLGQVIDGEGDGQPDALAVGDDDNDSATKVDYRTPPLPSFADDEDGLISVSIQPNGSLQFDVMVTDPVGNRAMFLDIWVDLNNDGFLADRRHNLGLTNEDVIIGAAVTPGMNTINSGVLSPPLQPGEHLGFIRMRLSSVGSLLPYGPWIDGEVEDHFDIGLDWGDAPANEDPDHPGIPWGYPTTVGQNGARHVVTQTIRLGQYVDAEGLANSSIFADGDDNQSDPDDEDGVFFDEGFAELFMALDGDPNDLTYVPGMIRGQVSDVIVHPSIIGDIDAWFDWNRDGDWDDEGEWVLQGVDVHPQSDTLQITIPSSASPGFTFSRFRFTANGTNGPSGTAIHGEVEDYLMFTMTPSPVGSTGDGGDANPGDGICDDGSGQCTLRAAIEEANASGNPTVIDFSAFGKNEVVVSPTSPLPVFTAPIVVLGSGELTIDGANAGAGAHGLQIQSNASSVLEVTVRNFDGDGIRIAGNGNMVRGSVLQDNGGAGVRIVSGTSNRIIKGAFSGNGGLGIDLGVDGVSDNDIGDGDSGPNNLQNFPVLTLVTGENGRVEGTVGGPANGSYTIQLYRSEGCDASGYGQGAAWLATLDATADGSGQASFGVNLPQPIPIGAFLTATATNAGGDTSEFSSCFMTVTTSIERREDAVLPTGFELGQNYPNPFNPSTTIGFTVPRAEFVTINVYSVLGKQVASLVNQRMEPGEYEVTFDASALPSGTYIYQMSAGGQVTTRQLTLLK